MLSKQFNIDFNDKNQTDLCFISYFSDYDIFDIDSKSIHKNTNSINNIVNKNKDGQLFLVVPTNESIKTILSNNSGFCISLFDNDDNYDNDDFKDNNNIFTKYCDILDQQGAYVKLLNVHNQTYICALNKLKLNEIINFSNNIFHKKFNKYPSKFYFRITSNLSYNNNFITNNTPDKNNGYEFFFEINDIKNKSITPDIMEKMNLISKEMKIKYPNININFDTQNFDENKYKKNIKNNNFEPNLTNFNHYNLKDQNNNDYINNDNNDNNDIIHDLSDCNSESDNEIESDIDNHKNKDSDVYIESDNDDNYQFNFDTIKDYSIDLSNYYNKKILYFNKIDDIFFNNIRENALNNKNNNMLILKYIFFIIWGVKSHFDIPIHSNYWNINNDNNINIDQYIKNDIEYLNNNYTNFEIDLRYKFFYNMII